MYLQPEPLLQDPLFISGMAMAGHSLPAYSYALNNPVAYIDPNGKNPGTAAGAAVGTFIAPGVGTLVGAVVGTAVVAAGLWCVGTSCLSPSIPVDTNPPAPPKTTPTTQPPEPLPPPVPRKPGYGCQAVFAACMAGCTNSCGRDSGAGKRACAAGCFAAYLICAAAGGR